MIRCPKCSSNNVATERRIDGDNVCGGCGYKWKSPRPDFERPGASQVVVGVDLSETVTQNSTVEAARAFPTFDVIKDPKEIMLRLIAYRCHKIVNAARIVEIAQQPGATDVMILEDPRIAVVAGWEWTSKHKVKAGGYLVVYDDGYVSFSPAPAFERGYTRVGETVGHMERLLNESLLVASLPKGTDTAPPRMNVVDDEDPINLSYYKPGAEGLAKIAILRRCFIAVSKLIIRLGSHSRERQLALTHLEKACMYVIKSVVVNDPEGKKEKP